MVPSRKFREMQTALSPWIHGKALTWGTILDGFPTKNMKTRLLCSDLHGMLGELLLEWIRRRGMWPRKRDAIGEIFASTAEYIVVQTDGSTITEFLVLRAGLNVQSTPHSFTDALGRQIVTSMYDMIGRTLVE